MLRLPNAAIKSLDKEEIGEIATFSNFWKSNCCRIL